MKTTMIQYFANIMTAGYKSTKIPLQVKSDLDAQMMTRAIADRTPDCIGYSTAVKVPGKKIQYI